MDHRDAVALIQAAVTTTGGVWADLGAGFGTFTRALAALLGPGGTVYAVDRHAASLRELAASQERESRGEAAVRQAAVRTVVGDFAASLELPPLDGVVIANALHYVPYADQATVLRHVASLTKPGAPIVVVEYDRQAANEWVPFPIRPAALGELARNAGLDAPALLGTRPSRFSGTIYAAVVRRPPR